jgi:hypothetical protein
MVHKDGSKKDPDHGRSEGDRFVTRDVAANKYNSGTGSENSVRAIPAARRPDTLAERLSRRYSGRVLGVLTIILSGRTSEL